MPIAFGNWLVETFPCYCETFSKKVVSGCIDSLPRRFLNREGISFAPATNLSNLLTEESGGSSLNRRTFVNCETTHGDLRRRDKLVQFRHEILPFPALSKTKLNFLIITNEGIGGKDCLFHAFLLNISFFRVHWTTSCDKYRDVC